MSLFHLASGELRKENDRLELEIGRLKHERDTTVFIARDRLDRLNKANNIINELEKYINEQIERSDYTRLDTFEEVCDYLQELKGSDENGK